KFHGIVRRQLLIDCVVRCKLKGNLEHVLAEQGHPGGAVGLLQMSASRQWRTAVEDTDIIEAEKPAFKKAPTKAIFPIDPPAEIGGEPAEHPLQEVEIGSAAQRLLHAVEENRRPGLYRRVDVAEVPLIRRDLTGRVQINLAQKQIELLFGEI